MQVTKVLTWLLLGVWSAGLVVGVTLMPQPELWVGGLAAGAALFGAFATAALVRGREAGRRRVEEAANQAVCRRLAAEKARGDVLLAQLPVPVAVWAGSELRCVDANAAYREVNGETVGRTFAEVFPGREREPLDEVLRTGEPAEVQEKVGRGRHVVTSLRAVPEGVLAIEVDVTARVVAEAELQAKDELFALLGHELRNPLAPIQTALELMRMDPDRPNERQRAVIERQTRHLMQLVDDMLDVARITRGKLELRREHVGMADIVAKAVELAGPVVQQRAHQLVTELDHNLIVDGDIARLVRVVANLVTNAAKYTDPYGQIRITVGRDGEHCVLSVRDNGRGIEPALLPHVFERFVQGRAEGGLGLGLSIARSLIELHGGAVSAHSDGPGTGTEVVIRLPLAEPAPAASEPRVEGSAPTARVVLVVDDNEDAAELLAALLRKRGCEVHIARDGADALHQAARVVPDVAVLDIGLPVMDGYELARRLRELPEWRDVRLVALTGYGHDSDRERSTEAGFQYHLVKPVDAARILQVVHEGDAVPVAIN